MFGGLTKTYSRIAIAAALGLTLGGFAMSASPARAADLGGDCCADLEERVAELEATTVRKGNKKVSVTLSGWVVKLGSLWDDGHETNFYVGDRDTALSSHFQLSGSAAIAPGWSGGYTIKVEAPGTGCAVGFVGNQFNDNACTFGDINTLLSYMWVKSDKYGTINWGQLSQATDNVALLPDLSGTIIESNAVLYDGNGLFVRPKGARNSSDLAVDFTWAQMITCLGIGLGLGADCNGYPENAFRYDTPTFAGFSMSTSYGEDDMWDVAVRYAADWNSVKFSAAAGYSQLTDEGCNTLGKPGNGGGCTGAAILGGGGLPSQGYRKDVDIFQAGASIMHVPSGLFVYGMYENEQNNGTQYKSINFNTGRIINSAANENETWFFKAGIKKAWLPLGATVLWGEWGQYNDMFTGICGAPGGTGPFSNGNTFCLVNLPNGYSNGTDPALVTGSTVDRWGVGFVQEIDSAAMHVFARWQHVELDLHARNTGLGADFGKQVDFEAQALDIFQLGGVVFF